MRLLHTTTVYYLLSSAPTGRLEVVRPSKRERLLIITGEWRGATGTLIGIDGADGIVKMSENSDIKILALEECAKLE